MVLQAFAYAEDLKVSLTNGFNEERKSLTNDFNEEIKRISEGSGSCRIKREPSIVYSTLANAEVRRRTGFQMKSYLTGFIIIVCNADHDKMKKKIISLT